MPSLALQSCFHFNLNKSKSLGPSDRKSLCLHLHNFFRSRPVVRVDGNVLLEVTNGQIEPENKTCTLKSGTDVSCLSIQGCLIYEGNAVANNLGKQKEFCQP